MFLIRADDSGGRGPYDDFWYGPITGKSAAGIRVNDETAMRLAVLYACVNMISQDLAKVPLMMFRRKENGNRERVTDHPAIQLLRNPARNMTGIDWKQRLQAHQLTRGNAYCHMRDDYRGRTRELYPWKPSNVRVEVKADESLRYLVRDPQSGRETVYVEGEVLHLRGLSLDGPLGLSPIDETRETLGEALTTQAYGASFFANDARPGLWLEHPTHFKDESVRAEWLARFKRAFGGANRFTPMLTEYGIKINQMDPVSHADLQFIELRKFSDVQMCGIYRVPPHKVGILDRSTFSNIEHQAIEYVTDCLLTWCRRWEERLALDLLTESERDEYYFEFVLDALMRGDIKTRYEAYTAAVIGGWLIRNEVRKRENLDALPNLDEPLQPLNMVPAGTPPAAAAPASDPNPNPDDAANARAAVLELAARRRVLNRETRALSREWDRSAGNLIAWRDGVSTFYALHARYVSEALAIEPSIAQAYCLAQCNEIEAATVSGRVPALLDLWHADATALDYPPLPAAQPRKE